MKSTEDQRSRARVVSLCIDLRAYYRQRAFPSGFENLLMGSDGTALSAVEAVAYLVIERARGHAVIPVSASCGKPCEHAHQGCKGFDHTGGGCPGYYPGGV